jgi:hypothetical protein
VTALAVRGGRVRATIVNGGRETAASTVSLVVGAAAPVPRAIDIRAGETQVVEFDAALPATGDISVRVSDPGGIPADDVRHLVIDPAPPRRVLVVTSGLEEGREAFYVGHALTASAEKNAVEIRTVGGTALRERFADALADVDIAIVLSTRGIERSGPPAIGAFRERGGGVLLVAGPTAEPGVLASMLDAGDTRAIAGTAGHDALVLSDARHPVFASLGPLGAALGSVRVTRSMFLEAPRLAVLARYTSGAPALAERLRTAQEGRTLVLTTDIGNAWNDLALHPAFVPLMYEMTAHLDGRPRRAREYLVGSPDAPASRPGVAASTERGAWRTAVNVDPAESDSAVFLDAEARSRIAVDDRTEEKAAAAVREREAQQPLWRFAIVAVMALLLAEGVAGRRLSHVGTR